MAKLLSGKPVAQALGERLQARSAALRAPGMAVNIDGRIEAMDEAVFSILPGALRMRRPANP